MNNQEIAFLSDVVPAAPVRMDDMAMLGEAVARAADPGSCLYLSECTGESCVIGHLLLLSGLGRDDLRLLDRGTMAVQKWNDDRAWERLRLLRTGGAEIDSLEAHARDLLRRFGDLRLAMVQCYWDNYADAESHTESIDKLREGLSLLASVLYYINDEDAPS